MAGPGRPRVYSKSDRRSLGKFIRRFGVVQGLHKFKETFHGNSFKAGASMQLARSVIEEQGISLTLGRRPAPRPVGRPRKVA